ncbi:surface protease GP63 [Trypanosoma cruzi]|nr:surface protease GP63 [Trypanosoma cruzi]
MDLSRAKIRPKMALQITTSKASLDGCGRVVTHGLAKPGARETAGYSTRRLRAISGDHISVPRCLCLPHFFLDDHSAAEEEGRMFRAFGVATWAPRIWDEGVSGDFLDLRGAYNYWKRADDQAQLVFDSLFAWMCALEAERDLTDRFMNFGRTLLREFRMQLMMASDPGIPLFNILARLYNAVQKLGVFARATQILLERRGTQISLRCQLCHVYGHVTSKSNARDAAGGSYSQHGWPLKTAEGLLAVSYESGRRQLPSIPPPPAIPQRRRTAPPMLHPMF